MSKRWTDADVTAVRERLTTLAAELPGVSTEEMHGHSTFDLGKKRFGYLLVDHHGDDRLALAVKAPPGEQDALVADAPDRYFVPAYLGARGWVGVHLDPGHDPDWGEVAALLEQGWRMTAGKRLVAEYDAQHG